MDPLTKDTGNINTIIINISTKELIDKIMIF